MCCHRCVGATAVGAPVRWSGQHPLTCGCSLGGSMRGEGPSILVAASVAGASWPLRSNYIEGRNRRLLHLPQSSHGVTPQFISGFLGALGEGGAVTILLLNVLPLRHRVTGEGTFLEAQSLSPGYESLMLMMSDCRPVRGE